MSTESISLVPVIRRLTRDDLDRVIHIETDAYPFPWTREIFADCLRVGYDCVGLQVNGYLAGYFVQMKAAGEAHLLNLCIAPDWQRKGYGSLLLEQAIRTATIDGCSSMFLEVRPSNRAGISLYKRRGFYQVGERPQYYQADNGRENALILRIDLPGLDRDVARAKPLRSV